jgi:predicted MFS family arabinose efflux permease
MSGTGVHVNSADARSMSEENSAQRPWILYSNRQRKLFLGVLFLSGTSAYIDRGIITVILEPIKAEFAVTDTMLGLLTGLSFALFYATLGIPLSRWADKGDRPLVITAAIAFYSLSTALCGFAHSFWQLALARLGVGAGEGGVLPCAQSLIADYFPPERRARANGFYLTYAIVATILTLTVGTRVAQLFGWRAVLVAAGVPGLIIAWISWTILAEPRRQVGFPTGAQESLRPAIKALFKKRSYVNILIGLVLYYLMVFGALVFLVSFMVRVHHMTLTGAGALAAAVTGGGQILGYLIGGAITDGLAARNISWLTRLPGAALILCCPLFTGAFASQNNTLMAIALFAGSLSISATIPAILSAIHAVCGSGRRATAFVVTFSFSNLIGVSVGPLLVGLLSDLFAQSRGAAEGLRLALMVAMTAFLPAGWFLLRATKSLRADLEG